MSTFLIKNATVLPLTQQAESFDLTPQTVDVLVQGDRITQIAPILETPTAQVIDATDQLLMPGLIDAHTHTGLGVLEKCGYEALPLELWMLYLPPDQHLDPRLHYLATMIAALEAVKHGTTTLQDDIFAYPYTAPVVFDAVAQAYADLGVRANLSLHGINQPLHDTIPYLAGLLSDDLKHDFSQAVADFSVQAWADQFRACHQKWHGQAGRIQTMLAPSASQRVTPDLMQQIAVLSDTYNVPIHVHLLETRTQAVTGPQFYGESVIAYAKRHGILTHRTTIAHGVWLTSDDIDLVAEAGASIVHNPVSNHRLCSGIASIRALMQAGINIALGTDGMDSFNLFNVMRMAGLVHTAVDADYTQYPTAADVLQWATRGGAKAAMLDSDIGAIAVGMKADFALYDLNTFSFTPSYDLPISLVYAESGCSIRRVFVNGQPVVENSKVLTVNEADIISEFKDRLLEYRAYRANWHQQAAKLRPIMDQVFTQAMAYPLPIDNFSGAGLNIRKS